MVNVVDSMREGITYIFKTKEILGALCLDMFAVLFGGAVAMIPVFATDILNAGAEGFGLLNAASDIGSMCIITLLSIVPLRKNQGKILLIVVTGFGLCIIGFGLSKLYWLSFMFLVMSGMLDGIFGGNQRNYRAIENTGSHPWSGAECEFNIHHVQQ